MPDEPEAHGLLALMMIHHARRRARFSGQDLVLLDDQDRSLWDMPQIAAGRAALDRAVAQGGRGAYVIQAAIASLQTAEPIDWPQVAGLYRRLAELTGSPRWTRGQGAPSACAPAAPPHEPIRPGGRSPAAMGLVVFRSPSLPLSRLAPPRVLQSVGGWCAARAG